MQTSILQSLMDSADGREADRILRACTHCGFCTATCPTYQLLGDERDSPRGRIYLIKQVLEGQTPSRKTQHHLDRCLTCRACETTCPSGVEYGRLVDIGRRAVDGQVRRDPLQRILRWGIIHGMAYPRRARLVIALGRLLRRWLPSGLQAKVPQTQPPLHPPKTAMPPAQRRMLLLDGCVQPAVTPRTNEAAVRVFGQLGVHLVSAPEVGCCGALPQHLDDTGRALRFARRNIDAWWPHVEAGAEAILMTATGCGAQVVEYGYLLRDERTYAEKAARISALTCEPAEMLGRENLKCFAGIGRGRRVAWHPPCTLQNSPGLHDRVPAILTAADYRLIPVSEVHLCCGSAGTYSILQPQLAKRLRDRKLDHLHRNEPDLIATANVGCQMHLKGGSETPVRHWLELLMPDTADGNGRA